MKSPILHLKIIFVTFVLVFLTLLVPVPVFEKMNEYNDMRYFTQVGYPFHFLTQELSYDPPGDIRSLRYPVQSPHEHPSDFEMRPFILSVLSVYIILLAVVFLKRRYVN